MQNNKNVGPSRCLPAGIYLGNTDSASCASFESLLATPHTCGDRSSAFDYRFSGARGFSYYLISSNPLKFLLWSHRCWHCARSTSMGIIEQGVMFSNGLVSNSAMRI